MMIGRPPRIAALLTATALTGCAQQGPLVSHRTSLRSLETSVSHLQYENSQLRRQVTDLKADNRRIENQLVQEQAENGQLSKRLDDARYALRNRGDAWDDLDRAANPEPSPPKTLPAGRSNRKPRKPPFARIPGQVDPLPPNASSRGLFDDDPKIPRDDDPGPQSWRDDGDRWLPIARGSGAPSMNVR